MHSKRYALSALCIVCVAIALGRWALNSASRPDRAFEDAWSAFQNRNFTETARRLAGLRKATNLKEECLLLQGGLMLRSGRFEEALECFRALRPNGRIKLPLIQLTAESLYWLKRYPESELLYTQLVHHQPKDSEPHRWLGAIYFDIGLTGAAVFELQKAIELNPKDYRPHRLLGQIYFDGGRFAMAIEQYELALKLNPDQLQSDILEELAVALIKSNHFQEALEITNKFQSITAQSLFIRAECEWSLGQTETAQETIAQALVLDSNNRNALMLRAKWLLADGHPADAAPLFERVLALDPHNVETRYQFALALQRLGLQERYETQFEMLETSKRLHKEYSILQDRAWSRPDEIEAREKLAKIARQLGKPEVAQFWLQAVAACRKRLSEVSENSKTTP